MNNPIPPEWRSALTLGVAGLFGSASAIPSMRFQAIEQAAFYILTGVVSAIYLSPAITEHFGINISASGFLCGSFAGSVIAKVIELVKSLRLQDILIGLFKKGGD